MGPRQAKFSPSVSALLYLESKKSISYCFLQYEVNFHRVCLHGCGSLNNARFQNEKSGLRTDFCRSGWPSARAHFYELLQIASPNEGPKAKVSIFVNRHGPLQAQFSIEMLTFLPFGFFYANFSSNFFLSLFLSLSLSLFLFLSLSVFVFLCVLSLSISLSFYVSLYVSLSS